MDETSPRSRQRRHQTISKHRQEILDAAEYLFGKMGYAQVAMEDVAERCLFSRRTLYRYFATKEVLAGELTIQALEELLSVFQTLEAPSELSGLQQIRRQGQALATFALERTSRYQSLRLRWFVGVPDETKRPLLERIVALNQQLEALMMAAVAKGQADGSVRPELEPRTTSVSVMGSSAGLLDTLVAFGPRYAMVYGVGSQEVWQSHLDLIERGLASSV